MSSDNMVPFAKIEQGVMFPSTVVMGESVNDLPSLLKSINALDNEVNSHLTRMCDYWKSVKPDSEAKPVAGKRQEKGKQKQQMKNGKKFKPETS